MCVRVRNEVVLFVPQRSGVAWWRVNGRSPCWICQPTSARWSIAVGLCSRVSWHIDLHMSWVREFLVRCSHVDGCIFVVILEKSDPQRSCVAGGPKFPPGSSTVTGTSCCWLCCMLCMIWMASSLGSRRQSLQFLYSS